MSRLRLAIAPYWARHRSAIGRVWSSLVRGAAEILTASAFIGGWLFLTDAIARLPHCAPAIVWRASIGLLAMSLGGWKMFGQIVWRGLYSLSRD